LNLCSALSLIPSENDQKQGKESRIPSKPIISNPHFFALNTLFGEITKTH